MGERPVSKKSAEMRLCCIFYRIFSRILPEKCGETCGGPALLLNFLKQPVFRVLTKDKKSQIIRLVKESQSQSQEMAK